jgi:hypothetical protein
MITCPLGLLVILTGGAFLAGWMIGTGVMMWRRKQ